MWLFLATCKLSYLVFSIYIMNYWFTIIMMINQQRLLNNPASVICKVYRNRFPFKIYHKHYLVETLKSYLKFYLHIYLINKLMAKSHESCVDVSHPCYTCNWSLSFSYYIHSLHNKLQSYPLSKVSLDLFHVVYVGGQFSVNQSQQVEVIRGQGHLLDHTPKAVTDKHQGPKTHTTVQLYM